MEVAACNFQKTCGAERYQCEALTTAVVFHSFSFWPASDYTGVGAVVSSTRVFDSSEEGAVVEWMSSLQRLP